MADGSSRRFRRFLLASAGLAIFVCVFQISSIDHHTDPNSTVIQDSVVHAAHCHSAQASCADATGLTSSLAEINLVPAAPPAHPADASSVFRQPIDASVQAPSGPPRST